MLRNIKKQLMHNYYYFSLCNSLILIFANFSMMNIFKLFAITKDWKFLKQKMNLYVRRHFFVFLSISAEITSIKRYLVTFSISKNFPTNKI